LTNLVRKENSELTHIRQVSPARGGAQKGARSM
jgi:hypothetical protein